ncbi:MAG: ABC transporter ATP-binding protein [Actinomycetota bacterium]|nr:ABC transporter ATP-binding protein [Actinomycetota bacterium]
MTVTESDAPAVELVGISKSFPGVLANDDVHFSVRRGEVHCLLGENGAGKSTLISILSGMQRPDSGSILVDGAPVRIRSPRDALSIGIGTVYQHSTLIPALTVLENLMLGESRRLLLDKGRARRRMGEIASMLGVEVDPDSRTGDLALGRQQQVEIASALWKGSRVLVLDEPTSMLTPQGVEELEKVLVHLKEQGTAIIFITHKLHEALAVSDRITVLRRGRTVGTISEEEIRSSDDSQIRARIVTLMFGDEAADLSDAAELQTSIEEVEALGARHVPPAAADDAEPVLELRSVTAPGDGLEPGVVDVSLTVRAGQVLGVAGIDGNGQRALAEVIAGQRRARSGTIELFGASVNRLGVSARQKLGLRYVTDDRLGEGIVRNLSVSLNLLLKRIGEPPFWRGGRIDGRRVGSTATALVGEYDIRTPTIATRAGTLSGGNIQKLLLARELSLDPKLVVFNKPTYGLDLRTTENVREIVRRLASAGAGAVLISTDLDELLELAGEIAVLSMGRIVGTVENGPDAAERIGALMIGDTGAPGAVA